MPNTSHHFELQWCIQLPTLRSTSHLQDTPINAFDLIESFKLLKYFDDCYVNCLCIWYVFILSVYNKYIPNFLGIYYAYFLCFYCVLLQHANVVYLNILQPFQIWCILVWKHFKNFYLIRYCIEHPKIHLNFSFFIQWNV